MADHFPLEIWVATVSRQDEEGSSVAGWGSLLLFGPFTKPIGGGAAGVTPTELELTALIQTFGAVKRPVSTVITIVSPSAPLDIPETLVRARANGWKNDGGLEMLHADLWKRLDELLAPFDGLIKWNWVQSSGPSTSDGAYLVQARRKAEAELAGELKKHKIGQAAQ